MAKNVSREFATMDDDERRRFALEQAEHDPDKARPLEFSDEHPRSRPSDDEEKTGGGRK